MEDLCRVCMKNSDILTDIFTPIESTPLIEDRKACIANILNELTGYKLVVHCKNGLPQYICETCTQRAKEALEFKRLVEENSRRYLDLQGSSIICKSESMLKQDENELIAICDMLDPEDLKLIDCRTKEEPESKNFIVAICDMLESKDLELVDLDNCVNEEKKIKNIVHMNTRSRNSQSTTDNNKNDSNYKGRADKCNAELRCPECRYILSSKGNLITHMRIHTGERPYQCPHCPKNFIQKQSLTVHIRTHTGERPFRCDSCPEAFAQMAGFVAHNRRRPSHQLKVSKNMNSENDARENKINDSKTD